MNTETKQPRYFRLLEKGECRQIGDLTAVKFGLSPQEGFEGLEVTSDTVLRPVQVDEWIEYAKQKPTKEDFEPTGTIQTIEANSLVARTCYSFDHKHPECSHWRRITHPQQPKPKSVTISLKSTAGHVVQNNVTIRPDGTVYLACGDILSAESIDQFIKAREEVTKK